LGATLRKGLQATFDRHDVAAQVTGIASLFQVHVTGHPVVDYRSARGDEPVLRSFFLGMLNQGIVLAPRGAGAVCTPMGEQEVETFLDAADRVVAAISAVSPAAR
ncbi:MAG: aspartate aminotransferase family protein, partial [Candidatus Dormibacteraceae bacterium]